MMTMTDISLIHPASRNLTHKVFAFFKATMASYRFNRTTYELSLLNDHVLDDIGLNRANIARATTIEELHNSAVRR
jgi:uncharacterized protein YjiS (DUF1127 family)